MDATSRGGPRVCDREPRITSSLAAASNRMIGHAGSNLLTGDARAPFDYILGCRLRQDTTVTEEVLARAGRYHPVDGRTSLHLFSA